MKLNEQSDLEQISDLSRTSIDKKDIWNGYTYSPLLNQDQLVKAARRNLWKYELNELLNDFDINDLNQEMKFRLSGKILNASTYLLKAKSTSVIDRSMEAQEDIKEAQLKKESQLDLNSEVVSDESLGIPIELKQEGEIPEIICSEYNEDQELYEAFQELENGDLLTAEQKNNFEKEKVNRVLNLEISELDKKLKARLHLIQTPLKVVYKRLELGDLAKDLSVFLKTSEIGSSIKAFDEECGTSAQLPFLPENFIANAEKKREDFECRMKKFFETLKNQYNGEPISFLKLVAHPTIKALVESLLIVLHLVNSKSIELWQIANRKDSSNAGENAFENSGTSIFLTLVD